MKQAKQLIGGEWVLGEEASTVYSPSTGEEFGEVRFASTDQVAEAVSAALGASADWADTPINERAEYLKRVAERLQQEYGEEGQETPLKKLIADEMGKRLPEADIEVIESADMLEYFSDRAADLFASKEVEVDKELWPNKKNSIFFEPHGVVAAIKPWNYPLELPVWALGPALVAGNTVVFKPSEQSSFVGETLVSFFKDAGIPDGVLNLIYGSEAVGRSLVSNPDVNFVAFTGSVGVGQEIAIECARHHRRCSLELGGNDAAILLDDANLDHAIEGITWGAFANAGQVCTRAKRLYVHESIIEEVMVRLKKRISELELGRDIGPIVSRKQLDTVMRQVQEARSAGAEVLAGGDRVQGNKGFYFAPTLLRGIPKFLIENECFGPVLPVESFKTEDEVIGMANSSPYGLGASVWTNNIDRATRIAKRLNAGMVWINDVNVAWPQLPWLGKGQSGPGVELGEKGMEEYVVPKTFSLDTTSPRPEKQPWWFPY